MWEEITFNILEEPEKEKKKRRKRASSKVTAGNRQYAESKRPTAHLHKRKPLYVIRTSQSVWVSSSKERAEHRINWLERPASDVQKLFGQEFFIRLLRTQTLICDGCFAKLVYTEPDGSFLAKIGRSGKRFTIRELRYSVDELTLLSHRVKERNGCSMKTGLKDVDTLEHICDSLGIQYNQWDIDKLHSLIRQTFTQASQQPETPPKFSRIIIRRKTKIIRRFITTKKLDYNSRGWVTY